eukprot:TRINITY_DN16245_c0_g1_i6.p1 TRINITY_DN16245_c0_g1~~TRINITY_DN16245_c0_g1_i6.p1  ORF type:complete len:893 (+),score=250.46 TRINITY_DN16245_c0_g1_i6:139-2817(+)
MCIRDRCEFMCGFFGIVLIVFLWGSTEKWKWHSHKSYENVFWGCVSFWASIAGVAKFGGYWWFPQSILLKILLIVATPSMVMVFHRRVQTKAMKPLGGKAREEIKRAFAQRENQAKFRRSISMAQLDSQEAKDELSHELNGLINDLDYGHMTMRAARYRTVQAKQSRIYSILYGATREELNYILTCTDVNLAMLLLNVKDYEVFEFSMKRSKSGYFSTLGGGQPSLTTSRSECSLDGYDSDSSSDGFSMDPKLNDGPAKSEQDRLGARTKVLRLLCSDRLDELETGSKVVLIDALMKLGLQAHKMNEHWLWEIVRSTEAEALTRLKNLMDSKGTYHTLFKLVYHDILKPNVLLMVKEHLTREGRVVRARRMWRALSECWRRRQMMPADLFTKGDASQLIGLARIMVKSANGETMVTPAHVCGSGSPTLTCLKLLSDLDDTLYSSGGDGIGGVDITLEKHVLYPGVLAFLREMDMGPLGGCGKEEAAAAHGLGNVVFLSARPHLYKNMSESYSYSLFETLQKDHGLHCSPTLLAGELRSSLTNTGIAEKKLDNYKLYTDLYPEYNFIFIGDNGQGDVIAGSSMLQQDQTRCVAVFIHQVQAMEKTPGYTPTEFERWQQQGICFFEHYIQAAHHAYTIGLLSLSALRRVTLGSIRNYNALSEPSHGKRAVQRDLMRASLAEAIQVSQAEFPEGWQVPEKLNEPPLALPPPTQSEEGTDGERERATSAVSLVPVDAKASFDNTSDTDRLESVVNYLEEELEAVRAQSTATEAQLMLEMERVRAEMQELQGDFKVRMDEMASEAAEQNTVLKKDLKRREGEHAELLVAYQRLLTCVLVIVVLHVGRDLGQALFAWSEWTPLVSAIGSVLVWIQWILGTVFHITGTVLEFVYSKLYG